MKATPISLARTAALLAGATLVLASVRAAEADALPTFDSNYIKLSATGASLDGNKAAYQARTQTSKAGNGGIEDFSYNYDLTKDDNLQINGKVMPTDGDYLAQFKLTKTDFGTLEAGYKRFRTFYDGHGGFFPTNNAWLQIYREPLFVDRGKFFVNATLAMPKAPVFTFKYSNETRTGRKDSTIWGDTDLTGIPIWNVGSLNPVSAARKILPAYIQLGERQETWEASMQQTVANTTATVTIGGDRINNRDWRSIDRFVGELRPWPPIPTSPAMLVPNNFNNNPNRGVDLQGFRENGITAAARVETVMNDKVTVFAGVNYHHARVSVDASRLIDTTMLTAVGIRDGIGGFYLGEPTFSPRISASRPPYSYTSYGHLKQDVLTGNIGVQTKPRPDLGIDIALKGEQYYDSGDVLANYVTTGVKLSTGDMGIAYTPTPEHLSNSEKPWTPAVDVRYTGIRNVALYGSWEYRSTSQDERTTYSAYSFSTSATTVDQAARNPTTLNFDHIKERHHNASVGVNWTPVRLFSGRAEVFTKDHQNRFEGYGPSAGGYYVLDYDIYGAKLTGVVKPLPVLSLTTRYIVQRGKAASGDDAFAKATSNDAHRYQLSETIDWNPGKTVYMQANGSIVYDQIVTAYPYVTGTAKDVIRNSDNNYWNADVILGTALDKDTDLQLMATYYKAQNFDPAQAYATLPLGASATEYTITAGVKYRIAPKTVATAKVGYIDSKNDTTGGFTNFRGPVAYVALERAF
jgi:hypothetical protein